jgi:predicted O-linked N-acetylglucosamine transferase (SPINDLY family)
MGLGVAVDAAGKAVFDEFIEIQGSGVVDHLRQIRGVAEKRNAQVFYMPSVGMFPITLYLACLRLAPVMAMALGHPATSRSPVMDYVVVEEDYVGDPACFSEELLLLPSDGMPYRPSGLAAPEAKPMIIRENPREIHICVAASVMKINPGFLKACSAIAQRSSIPVKFHFLVGQAIGLVYKQVARVVHSFLREHAIVYRHTPYAGYMEIVRGCDMFINPFPFGNTNGIIDCITAGLVGVCKSGREVNEHIDEGLFKRFELPDWLITRDTESYIQASLRLIQEHDLRNTLRQQLTGADKVGRIFQGRPEIMGQKFMDALRKKIH